MTNSSCDSQSNVFVVLCGNNEPLTRKLAITSVNLCEIAIRPG